MPIQQKLIQKLVLIAFLSLLLTPNSWAAAPAAKKANPAAAPDPMANTMLAQFSKAGAKIYYMGNHSGLDGWFILKDNQMQIIYTTADAHAALVGALFGANGENLTMQQVRELTLNNAEVAAQLGVAAKEQLAIANAGSAAPVAPQAAATPVPDVIPSVTLSPGEKLLQDLSAARSVMIGSAATAPELFMVMDPNCPHCQATWRALRETVLAGHLRIRMIPIGTQDTDDERAAAVFLHVSDPLQVWDKYVGGDIKQLEGTPDTSLVADVRANHAMVDSWNIHATPYLAYRAKDGKIKVLQGEPEKISSLLNDLL